MSAKCDHTSVGILVWKEEKLLLIERKNFPFGFAPPAGHLDGDTYEEAAKRELLEETGYAGELHKISTCLEDSYSTKLRHNFVVLNCKKVSEPNPDKNEFIEPVLIPLNEFRELLRSGEITVVETGYMGLDYLKLL